jgi:organic hydroperoxide reductase OsmC/OhrA
MHSAQLHHYRARVHWTGNTGEGTARYDAYSRNHRIHVDGKPLLAGSADATFRGDAALHNPEDLFLASVAACHMLFYLALCARDGLRVLAYEDAAEGLLDADTNGQGRFREIHLRPRVTIATGADPVRAGALHQAAHARCFIANSCNVPVHCDPLIEHLHEGGRA